MLDNMDGHVGVLRFTNDEIVVLGWESLQQIVKLSILDLVITSDYTNYRGNFPEWNGQVANCFRFSLGR